MRESGRGGEGWGETLEQGRVSGRRMSGGKKRPWGVILLEGSVAVIPAKEDKGAAGHPFFGRGGPRAESRK